MINTQYQTWLLSLSPEQRAAVQTAVGVVMDALVMLEGRMANSEVEIMLMNDLIAGHEKRIVALERIVGIL